MASAYTTGGGYSSYLDDICRSLYSTGTAQGPYTSQASQEQYMLRVQQMQQQLNRQNFYLTDSFMAGTHWTDEQVVAIKAKDEDAFISLCSQKEESINLNIYE